MGDSSMDEIDPSEKELNFGFGFNDIYFSDRVLRLQILPVLSSNMNSCGDKYRHWFSSLDDAKDSEIVEELKVITLHISCILLAAKSQFFFKLFKSGMRESQKKDDLNFTIHALEEAAFMDMLNFIYDRPLNATSGDELVDVLMAADKFEVISCMKHCIQLLLNLPMTTESAVLYLELPSSVLVGEVVQPLLDKAKKYLADHFRDFTESQQEAAMALPLSAIQVVLGSDGLKVNSEDVVFDFILKWAREHYPNLDECRENLTNHLVRYICFPYMSCSKLEEVVDYPDFHYEQVSKLVINALSLKAKAPYPCEKHFHASKDRATTKCSRFPRRVYDLRLIKVVAFEVPRPRCIVYLDLNREDCAYLVPSHSHTLDSHTFCLGGRHFFLMAQCIDKLKFGLFVKMEGSESCTLDIEFAVMKKPSEEFETVLTTKFSLTDTHKALGTQDLFKVSWADFMSDGSKYFIDGILHLRAQVTINN